MTSLRHSIDRNACRAIGFLGLVIVLFGLNAVPAAADATFGVELTRDDLDFPTVYREDERIDYTVEVSNTASSSFDVGAELFCDGKPQAWSPSPPNAPAFSIEWRRNGAIIPGAGGPVPGGQTYTTTADDAGKVIQCLVKGSNAFAGTKYASLPGTVVNPPPATEPPAASNRIAEQSRPVVTGSGTGMRTCSTDSMNWSGAPSFAFQWLANGDEISGATTSTYAPVVATGNATRTAQATGTGTRSSGSTHITNLVTTSGAFAVGESIRAATGFGIPEGTTIVAVDATSLTLSKPALGNGNVNLFSGSKTLTGFTTTTGAFADGERISGTGIENGTQIVDVDPGAGTIQLDRAVTSAGTSIVTAGADNGRNLQCLVKGTNPGGSLVGISNSSPVNGFNVPNAAISQTPEVGANITSGPVTVELELPGGMETRAHEITGLGWTCAAFPAESSSVAKAVCTREDALLPGNSYPEIKVVTALGDDVPGTTVTTKATVSGGGAAGSATATHQFDLAPPKGFGIEAVATRVLNESGASFSQAGGHPYLAGLKFTLNRKRMLTPGDDSNFRTIGSPKTVIVDAPRGLVGNALAIGDLCPTTQHVILRECSLESMVGGIDLEFIGGAGRLNIPIQAIEPEFGRPAQFAFFEGATSAIYVFFPRLRPEDGYAISFESAPVPAEEPKIMSVDVTLCGFGANVNLVTDQFTDCKKVVDAGANPKPLVTMPTRCDGPPPTTVLKIDSWQNPGDFKTKSFSDPPITGCELIEFGPEMELVPTSQRADSPTGMDVEIFMPTDGLESKTGLAQANLKRVTVTLPEGMAVNAAAGHGLGACTAGQVGIDPVTGVPNNAEARCPDSSKIGTIGITTPLIQSTLTGDVFIAKQGKDNPFDSNVALYMVFSSKKDGITIKVAGEVKSDPVTGRMTIVFDENPEAPFSSVELHFPQGPRSPLLNPPRCGTYQIKAELTPWSAQDPENPTAAETVVQTSTYEVNEGPGGGPCPDGRLDPKLNAGTVDPIAGRTSPFTMRLRRDDGTQRFTGLEVSPPQGLTAYLKGIPYCSDAALASISPAAETGQSQIDNPSCPAASQVGTASAGAGGGTDLFYVNTGKAYLAGPYKGAPLSLALVTPAVAGPLDLGNVVIRTALYVNPKTAQITAVSDPVPTILHGILLNIRDIRVAIDRPNFTLNPTNCEEMSVGAKVTGDGGSVANVSDRFQVGDCGALGFKPRLALSLKGGTKRGDNPSLRAVVRPRPGDANIGFASVTLPRSAFLDQAHIRTICTRVQFAADNCPKAAIYGRAEAITPLLDSPLRGPVYLRSSDNELPDLVADLRGPAHQPIKVEAAFRTDSVRGGIRSTLDFAPDAPVTKFTLRMQGGKKGLVVNSRNLCAKKVRRSNRARSRMVGQNGRRFSSRPKVVALNCGKKRKRAKHKRAGRGQRTNSSSSG